MKFDYLMHSKVDFTAENDCLLLYVGGSKIGNGARISYTNLIIGNSEVTISILMVLQLIKKLDLR